MIELRIKDMASLTKLVEALTLNGYKVQVATACKEWPHSGVDYFAVRVGVGEEVTHESL